MPSLGKLRERVEGILDKLDSVVENAINRLEALDIPDKYWELQEKIGELRDALSEVSDKIDDIRQWFDDMELEEEAEE